MKKIFKWVFLLFIVVIDVNASIPTVQGLKLGMNKDKALEVVVNWHKSDKDYKKSNYNYNFTDKKKSGKYMKYTYTVINGHYNYDELYFDKNEKLAGFKISHRTVNRIFHVKEYDAKQFAQEFVNSYDWIDNLEVNSQYMRNPFTGEYVSITNYLNKNFKEGWAIEISYNKTIRITEIEKAEKKTFR